MLYPIHLLASNEAAGGWRIVDCEIRGWRRIVLIPRQLCLFESIPCSKVRLHELSGFARVQAKRLSPFRHTGASAIRRAGRLHLWLWDADEVDELLAGSPQEGMVQQAEAIHLAWPQTEGNSTRRCSQVEEQLNCSNGALMTADAGRAAPLDLSVLARRPVAHDWLGGSLDAPNAADTSRNGVVWLNRAGVAAALAGIAYLGYEGGHLWGARDASAALEERLTQHVAARGQWADLEGTVRADEQWINAYLDAAAQLDIAQALAALRATMETFGVVIRELDVAGVQMRVTFVTAGGEIRLPELLQTIRQTPGVSNASLHQHKELTEAIFILDMPGFISHKKLGTAMGTRHGEH